MTSRRIAFLDVDGTLIDHRQRLAPSAIEAVRGARANGHLVYLCTGRSRTEIPTPVSDIGFDGAVSAGGGFVDRGDEEVIRHTMPAPSLSELVAFFEAHDVDYILQADDEIYPSRAMFDSIRPSIEQLISTAPAGEASADLERLERVMAYRGPAPDDAIAKATFYGADPLTFENVRDGLGERFHVITGTIPYLGGSGGEVSLRGVNKGAAILELLALLGMTAEQAIGIGDSHNDVEMLQVCGVGIAMGNAVESVKAHADEVTTGVDDDGVFTAFVRHGLI
ncbi:Cof-type HAD-IIB family hydrolase [Microbacterium sp. P04]|uniref:Cof-type HAD-IIB family hydrolase n=1 Tax=Microbacterium sp. P04 TaxID=3366947 RepID=UPI00374656D2